MSLEPGTRLGDFEILAPLGKGGMGEVYRARDHRLDRDMALKVLPDSLASDASRLSRFDREAKLLSPDGRSLLFTRRDDRPGGEYDIWVLDLDTGEPRPWMSTPFSERDARFSPDGRWIAYVSNETGRFEVYLQGFPEIGEKLAISTRGGLTPVWRGDGTELYFYDPVEREILAVPITLRAGPKIGEPTPLFRVSLRFIGGFRAQFDVSKDGSRFLLNRMVDERTDEPLMLMQNW